MFTPPPDVILYQNLQVWTQGGGHRAYAPKGESMQRNSRNFSKILAPFLTAPKWTAPFFGRPNGPRLIFSRLFCGCQHFSPPSRSETTDRHRTSLYILGPYGKGSYRFQGGVLALMLIFMVVLCVGVELLYPKTKIIG